jgi:hypothetical protein
MKKVRLFEDFVNEAKVNKGKVHKAAKQASYPATLVVIDGKKVVHQELVNTPLAVPAAVSVLKDKYPNCKIQVESRTGELVFVQESNEIELNENMKTLRGFLKELKKEYGPVPTEQSLADFIYNNYKAITGDDLEDADPEVNDHIADIIAHFRMDGEDFMIAWEDRVNQDK